MDYLRELKKQALRTAACATPVDDAGAFSTGATTSPITISFAELDAHNSAVAEYLRRSAVIGLRYPIPDDSPTLRE